MEDCTAVDWRADDDQLTELVMRKRGRISKLAYWGRRRSVLYCSLTLTTFLVAGGGFCGDVGVWGGFWGAGGPPLFFLGGMRGGRAVGRGGGGRKGAGGPAARGGRK